VLNTNQDVVGVFNGGTLISTTTSPLISLNNATINQTATSGSVGALLNVNGFGGPSGTTPATVTMNGPLLSVASTLNFQGRLVHAINGGTITVNDAGQAAAFVSLSGGTHSIATLAGNQMFKLQGAATAASNIVTPDTFDSLIIQLIAGGLTLATDQPLRRSAAATGAYEELSNAATVTTQQVLLLDKALLNASQPLLKANSGTSLTTTSDAISLINQARLNANTGINGLIQVGGTLNIAGHAVSVSGGSALLVTGDLFSIANAGKFNITNGGALFVSGGSIVNITGALVNFSGTSGNLLKITNNLCTNCVPFGDFSIPVELRNGAVAPTSRSPCPRTPSRGAGSARSPSRIR